jgi:hypothetical protein
MWDITTDNGVGERSHLEGTAVVGAWVLGKDDEFNTFRDFFTIGRLVKPSLVKFDVKLALDLIDYKTGKKRKIVLSLERLKLRHLGSVAAESCCATSHGMVQSAGHEHHD